MAALAQLRKTVSAADGIYLNELLAADQALMTACLLRDNLKHSWALRSCDEAERF